MKLKAIILILFFLCTLALSAQEETIQEEIQLFNGEVSLPGTLGIPAQTKKPPLLIFIHGSGNIDRNGGQGPALPLTYLKELADALNKRGIATYRYDKRTSSIENLKKMTRIRIADYADDARVAIEHFKDDSRFSGIHVMGHSQGSLVGLLLGSENLKSYTSLAGTHSTIDSIIVDQIGGQLPALKKVARDHFAELHKTDTILQVNPFLVQVFAPANQRFLKDWAAYDPGVEISKSQLPTLIIQGLADSQIPLKQGLGLAESRLPLLTDHDQIEQIRSNPDALQEVWLNSGIDQGNQVQLAIIPKLNHVLKEVNSAQENIKAYSDTSVPLSESLVEVLAQFILSIDG